jgi:hypothetical protein
MRKIRLKWLAGLLSALLIIIALAGCGSISSLAKPAPTEGAATHAVTGSCTISKNGDVFTVSGTTDIMNGALIDISVVAQDGTVIANKTITKTQDAISEQFTITAEQLSSVKDLRGYICCAPSFYGKQTVEVFGAYGNKFENITANAEDMVWNNEGIVLTFASDWLYGVVPETTPAPSPSPTVASSDTASADTSASPSA